MESEDRKDLPLTPGRITDNTMLGHPHASPGASDRWHIFEVLDRPFETHNHHLAVRKERVTHDTPASLPGGEYRLAFTNTSSTQIQVYSNKAPTSSQHPLHPNEDASIAIPKPDQSRAVLTIPNDTSQSDFTFWIKAEELERNSSTLRSLSKPPKVYIVYTIGTGVMYLELMWVVKRIANVEFDVSVKAADLAYSEFTNSGFDDFLGPVNSSDTEDELVDNSGPTISTTGSLDIDLVLCDSKGIVYAKFTNSMSKPNNKNSDPANRDNEDGQRWVYIDVFDRSLLDDAGYMRKPPDPELFILLTGVAALQLNIRLYKPEHHPYTRDELEKGQRLMSEQEYWGGKWSTVTDIE